MRYYKSLFFSICYLVLFTSNAQTKVKSTKHYITTQDNKLMLKYYLEFTEWGDTLLWQDIFENKRVDLLRKKFNEKKQIIETFRKNNVQLADSTIFFHYDHLGNLIKKEEKLEIPWSQERAKELSPWGSPFSHHYKLYTTTYYPNGKIKERLQEAGIGKSDKTYFIKKVKYDERGRLTYRDSLHAFLSIYNPNKKEFEHVVIKDTNTYFLDNKNIKFYRKLYFNGDSILVRTVEYRDNDSLVCKYKVNKGTLHQEYISDSKFKDSKKFQDIKNYFYGYDLQEIELGKIYDVLNLESYGTYELTDGFGRQVIEVKAYDAPKYEDGRAIYNNYKNQIFPMRHIYYDFHGNVIRDEFYFNPIEINEITGRKHISKNGKIARLYEYTYDVKGYILNEEIKGAIVDGIPFNTDYPRFMSDNIVIDSNLILIKSAEYKANKQITKVGNYFFSKGLLTYDTYENHFRQGTFIKVNCGTNAPDCYLCTGKNIYQKTISERAGLEAERVFYYDSNDSLIRTEAFLKSTGLAFSANKIMNVRFGQQDFLRVNLNGKVPNVVQFESDNKGGSLIQGRTYDKLGNTWHFITLNGDTVFSKINQYKLDDRNRKVFEYIKVTQKPTKNNYSGRPGVSQSLEHYQYYYDPTGKKICSFRLNKADTLNKDLNIKYNSNKIGEISLYEKILGPMDVYTKVRFVYEYNKAGNVIKMTNYRNDKIFKTEKWEYEYYD